jgi:hypothetical protein
MFIHTRDRYVLLGYDLEFSNSIPWGNLGMELEFHHGIPFTFHVGMHLYEI